MRSFFFFFLQNNTRYYAIRVTGVLYFYFYRTEVLIIAFYIIRIDGKVYCLIGQF